MEYFLLHSIALVITTAAIYHNALDCGFVFDDMSAIVDNQDLRPKTPITDLFWNDFWGTPMHKEKSHKSYRPLCVLTFRFNYLVSKLEPMSYHLVNVVLHAVVCILFMKMCGMFLKEKTSFLAAMLFAVHPIHTEAVTGVVGRAESLSSIFFLAAFMTYAKCTGCRAPIAWKPLLLTVAFVTVAMLCKEQGITVIAVCCVYEVFIAQRATFSDLLSTLASLVQGKPSIPSWLRTSSMRAGFLVFSTLFLLFARIRVMGAQLPVFTRFDNPASVSPTPTRQLTYNYLLPVNAWLLLNPLELCCDWTMGTVPVITSVLDPRNLATLAFYAVMVRLAVFALSEQTQRSRAVIMCLSLIVLPFVPASNLFFPVGFVVAERILYTPSLGFCMLVALGFDILIENRKSLRSILYFSVTLLLLFHSAKTFLRNYEWTSEYSLFRAALKVNQDNAKLWNNVGHALEKVEKYEEALVYFEKAASVQPDDIGAHINVGRTYNNLNMSASAEKAYRHAIDLFPPIIKGRSYTARVAPNHLNAYLNLANLVSKDPKRLDEARSLLQQAITMRSDFIEAYINLGDIFVKLGRITEAQKTYEDAIRVEPNNADLHFNLGVVHLEQKHTSEARRCFDAALRINPDHTQSLYNSAILMQESGDPKDRPEAQRRLKKLALGDPSDPKIFFNSAMLAMDEKKFDLAEVNFKKAIELDPKFRSALFNLALMYVNDVNRPMDSLPFIQQLLKYYPDHTKGLILMGDLNVNHLKDLDAAEQNFQAILNADPNHVQANHNLCVVYVEKGDLLRAEKCLVHALSLEPNADYIKNHLNIVRSRINQIRQQQRQVHQQQKQPAQQQQPVQQQHQAQPAQQQQPVQQQHQAQPTQQQQTHPSQQQVHPSQQHQAQPAQQQQTHPSQQQVHPSQQHQAQSAQQQQTHPSQQQVHPSQQHQAQPAQQQQQTHPSQQQVHPSQQHQAQPAQQQQQTHPSQQQVHPSQQHQAQPAQQQQTHPSQQQVHPSQQHQAQPAQQQQTHPSQQQVHSAQQHQAQPAQQQQTHPSQQQVHPSQQHQAQPAQQQQTHPSQQQVHPSQQHQAQPAQQQQTHPSQQQVHSAQQHQARPAQQQPTEQKQQT